MVEEGYNNITNIDICASVVKAMAEKYKEKGDALKYIQMDVRTMTFNEGTFDAIIDKATFDSILVIIP
jgi:ubiquinone/menaquinone biosynthesis C-methylase UbiE